MTLTRSAKDVDKERQIYITCSKEIVRARMLIHFTGTAGVPPAMSAKRENVFVTRFVPFVGMESIAIFILRRDGPQADRDWLIITSRLGF